MSRTGRLFEGLGDDVRHGLRGFLHRPGGALIVVATLAMGIGAATTVFTVVRSVLLRPLPFPDAEELVVVREVHGGRERSASPAGYLDWRRELDSFADLAAVDDRVVTLWLDERPARLPAATVSGNFFRAFGVEPALGRGFEPGVSFDASVREVVLGHALWSGRLGGARDVLGRTIRIGEEVLTVVGVMPPGFAFPEGAQLWIRSPFEVPPVGELGDAVTAMRDAWFFDVVGRLEDGVTLEAARAEAAALSRSLGERHPDDAPDGGLALRLLEEETVAASRPLLLILTGAVALVLLATCVDVAGLTLVRTMERSHELAVRTALGADRWRVARLVLVRTLLLAGAGGALGTLVALAALPSLLPLLPDSLPRLAEIAPDRTVLLAALATTILSGLVSALLPALRAARVPASGTGVRGGVGAPGRLGRGLVAAEVAIAVVLVTSSLLLVRSVSALSRVDPGFRAEGLITARLALPGIETVSAEERREAWLEVERGARAAPGIRAAALGSGSPVGLGPRATIRVRTGEGVEEGPDASWQPVTPGWFGALGVRLVAGRVLSGADAAGTPDVAVIDEALARAAFGSGDPLGRLVTIGLDGHDRPLTVVGVVESTRNRGPDGEPFPVLYRPMAQVERLPGTWTLAARTDAADEPAALTRLRRGLLSARPDLLVVGEARGVELGASSLAERRFLLRLTGAFGVVAVLLGSLGVYGVAAGTVTGRRREIGIRMAVGASRRSVVGRVLAAGLVPVLGGLAVGLAGAWGAGLVLRGMLFGVAPGDPATTGMVTAGLVAVALAASAMPAVRAAAVDPAETLREG